MGKVYQHELGRRHCQNLSSHSQREPKEDDESRKREPTEDSATLEIAPGEPVPPGFEMEINRQAQIQVRYALASILVFLPIWNSENNLNFISISLLLHLILMLVVSITVICHVEGKSRLTYDFGDCR